MREENGINKELEKEFEEAKKNMFNNLHAKAVIKTRLKKN